MTFIQVLRPMQPGILLHAHSAPHLPDSWHELVPMTELGPMTNVMHGFEDAGTLASLLCS